MGKKLLVQLVLLLFLITGCSDLGNSGVGKETTDYLEKRYGEKFQVEKVRYIPQNRSYEIRVHPKDSPDVSFVVNKWANMGYKLSDGYQRKIRIREVNKWLKPAIDKINKKNLINLWPQSIEDTVEYSDMTCKVEDIVKKYKEKMNLYCHVFYFFDITEKNEEETLKKVYELVEYIKSCGFDRAEIELWFYSEEFFKDRDVIQDEKDIGPSGMLGWNSSYHNYIKGNIRIYNKKSNTLNHQVLFSEIKTYKDIKKGLNKTIIIDGGQKWKWEK